jgi:hypothetical protein
MPQSIRVLEICGEGKTDIGEVKVPGKSRRDPEFPTQGVIPILVHRLCGAPSGMRVIRHSFPFLQRGPLQRKVRFFKRQAFYNASAGTVFVLDTEGNHPSTLTKLTEGRDSGFPDFPMAVGVAHPCIEAWLLADKAAIVKIMKPGNPPTVPPDPESLPAPKHNQAHNPKTVLAACAGGTVSAKSAVEIAKAISDLAVLRAKCPLSFEPFAQEVVERIAPLFA